ncbi:hypothetical protein GCM10022393_19460 [Aquimarina addita]|uniref:PKD domain-containing protein n=2 Tax=Aquimarina addita TaxID=870485 RepID=A0ABP6UIF9_9FLAO
MVTFFVGCSEDENDLSFINSVASPTEVSAITTIAQDNTGLVTLTPLGTAVINFAIDFGDGSEIVEAIEPGSKIDHIYTEGSYQVKIIGNGLSGKSTETTQTVEVSFNAPENLVVTIENDTTVSKQVNVTASADFAMFFDVYFGETGNDEPVTATIGETASYVYTDPGTYTIKVVAKGGALATTEYTEEFLVTAIVQPITSAATPPGRAEEDVISIFSAAYIDEGGADYFPDWNQGSQGSGWGPFDVNGDDMLQYTNLSYQGIQFGAAVDVTSMEFIHLDVWTADEITIETSLISVVNGEQPYVSDLTPNEWTSIDIPISAYTDLGLIVDDIHQLKFVGAPWAEGTVFIDNIYFYKGTVQTIGAAPTPSLPAANVISMFSDAYTDIPVDTWITSWSNAVLNDIVLDGNATKEYSALDFVGIEATTTTIDATSMTHFHTDIYSSDFTEFKIKLVDFGADGAFGGGDDVEHEITFSSPATGTWVSLDIPLSDFTGLTTRANIAQLIYAGSPTSNTTVLIDNVYFHN